MADNRIGRAFMDAAGIGHPSARRRSRAKQVLTTVAKGYAVRWGAKLLLRRQIVGAFVLGACISWWLGRKR
ncbi:MAG TPA: hypothetical protein VEJ18_19110 [Planctomycetota bacterium]|nr:hypothetical protein [Planctomycetota bacterium]